ncbi:MAG TPA: thiamine pyrophosphate-dependent enzyme [Kofleriaceae bacterium]
MPAREPSTTVADALAFALADLGVTHGFGIIGGAIAPFARALARQSIRVVHTRHESGAAFAAAEACFASGRPSAVFATTGPGAFNALTGMAAARWEGARVVMVSGATAAEQRGRWAFQETAGPIGRDIFHYAHALETADELGVVVRRLRAGLTRPDGFIAHLAVPLPIQTARHATVPIDAGAYAAPGVGGDAIARVAAMIERVPIAIWAGFGARDAADDVRRLAERLNAPVMCSPRGKGIFPETHPLFVGVTGFGGGDRVAERIGAARFTLVLGSRLGELTSFWDPALIAPEGLIHVDVDRDVFGAAYPHVPTLGVHAEIGAFVRGLVARLGRRQRRARATAPPRADTTPFATRSPVRPSMLLAAIQREVVERSDAIVMTEAGNAFAWGTYALRFDRPRYRVSVGFGSMGQATAGVVGAALARGKAIAIVGDGAMLMNSEVSTAVQYDAPAVWIVLNDSRYGMIEQGMRSQGWAPLETDIPPTCFATIARAMGALGIRVTDEAELPRALAEALAAPGPVVVDVVIDPEEKAPIGRRIANLIAQGAFASEDST